MCMPVNFFIQCSNKQDPLLFCPTPVYKWYNVKDSIRDLK